ncbi:hypothetical protein A2U01_0087549, partial [Trifolium medium]|nr:hypothetical protein [Trifolium medium]
RDLVPPLPPEVDGRASVPVFYCGVKGLK